MVNGEEFSADNVVSAMDIRSTFRYLIQNDFFLGYKESLDRMEPSIPSRQPVFGGALYSPMSWCQFSGNVRLAGRGINH